MDRVFTGDEEMIKAALRGARSKSSKVPRLADTISHLESSRRPPHEKAARAALVIAILAGQPETAAVASPILRLLLVPSAREMLPSDVFESALKMAIP